MRDGVRSRGRSALRRPTRGRRPLCSLPPQVIPLSGLCPHRLAGQAGGRDERLAPPPGPFSRAPTPPLPSFPTALRQRDAPSRLSRTARVVPASCWVFRGRRLGPSGASCCAGGSGSGPPSPSSLPSGAGIVPVSLSAPPPPMASFASPSSPVSSLLGFPVAGQIPLFRHSSVSSWDPVSTPPDHQGLRGCQGHRVRARGRACVRSRVRGGDRAVSSRLSLRLALWQPSLRPSRTPLRRGPLRSPRPGPPRSALLLPGPSLRRTLVPTPWIFACSVHRQEPRF